MPVLMAFNNIKNYVSRIENMNCYTSQKRQKNFTSLKLEYKERPKFILPSY